MGWAAHTRKTRLRGGANLAWPSEHGSVIANCMRLAAHVTCIIGGIFALSLGGCRSKPNRPTPPKSSASIVTPEPADAGVASPNLTHFEVRPIEIGEFSTLRARALSAVQSARTGPPSNAMVALAQAFAEMPGSAVLAIELVKVAARAHDQRHMQRFIQIAQPLTEGQPGLSKMLAAAANDKPSKTAKTHEPAAVQPAQAAQNIGEGNNFKPVCTWIKKSFAEGRPPVNDVGQQGTASIECQLLTAYDLAPEIQAVPVIAAAQGQGSRLFAWVAAKYKGHIWLSANVVENFVPPFHPDGNGFSIELQRAWAYHAGLPELSAYITERHAQIDVALNEQTTAERHEIIVMTFDVEPPQSSAPVILYSRTERSLVDPNDKVMPKGYKHSFDVGKILEQTFQLQWGDNRVTLTPAGRTGAKPIEKVLFAE